MKSGGIGFEVERKGNEGVPLGGWEDRRESPI